MKKILILVLLISLVFTGCTASTSLEKGLTLQNLVFALKLEAIGTILNAKITHSLQVKLFIFTLKFLDLIQKRQIALFLTTLR